MSVVRYTAAAHHAVGHIHLLAVESLKYGVENLYGLHAALHALRLNPVAHLVGLQEQNDYAAGEVLQIAAQRHAHGYAERRQQRREARGVDAQGTYYAHDEQHLQHYVEETLYERLHAHLHFAPLEEARHEVVDQLNNVAAYEIDHGRNQDVFAGIQGPCDELAHHLLPT